MNAIRKITKIILVLAMTFMQFSFFSDSSVSAAEKNLALNKPVVASGVEGGKKENEEWMYPHLAPEMVTDGRRDTRWSSDMSLPSLDLNENPDQNVWAYVDLEKEESIGKIVLGWQATNSRNYDIQISNDAVQWEVVKHYEYPGRMGVAYDEVLALDKAVQARYVRVYARVGTEYDQPGTMYPTISLTEIEVYEKVKEAGKSVIEKITKVDPILSDDGTHILLPDPGNAEYTVNIFGSSNKAVIAMDGTVTQPLETMEVNIFYEVTDSEGNKAHSDKANKITIPGRYAKVDSINALPNVIPAIREWKGNEGDFKFTGKIVIADASLEETAQTISMYLKEMIGRETTIVSGSPNVGDIHLVKRNHNVVGDEGYEMNIDDILTVSAPTATGILYGGATITQILYQDINHIMIPKGLVRDYPQYEVRAVMMDVARIYIPLEHLKEMTKYAAYFKLNEMRIHINDDSGEQGGSFRIESKKYPALNEGITAYTQEDYKNYQKELKKYGVDIVTEIDSPAHATVFGNVDPELILYPGHLDVANPKTLTFMKSLYDEFLDGDDPVFQGSKFHIGTDEYDKKYSENVRKYMDELITYVNGKGLETRMWASLGKNGFDGETPVNKNATAHVWSHGWGSWDDMLADGYNLINNADGALYVVPEGAYNNYLNLERLFNTWEVSDLLYGHHLDAGHPQFLGAEAAFWYDGANGQSEFDVFDRFRDQIMIISEKAWFGEKTSSQTGTDFVERLSKVDQFAPESNPARYVASKSEKVVEYTFTDNSTKDIKDQTENAYHAKLNNLEAKDGVLKLDGKGYMELPFDSLGYPYSASFDLRVEEGTPANAVLFKGKDGTLYYNYDNTGKIGYERKGYIYFFDFKIPTGVTTNYTLTCNQKDAILYVDGYKVGNGKYYKQTIAHIQESSTFVLPTEQIGKGVIGELDNFNLYNRVLSENEILKGSTLEYRNLALAKDVEASSVEGGRDEDGNSIIPEYAPEMAVDGDRGTRHVFDLSKEDAWYIVDLGEECLIDSYTIRFMEIPVSYRILISNDKENWEEVAVRKDLPGRATMADSVKFSKQKKARYVKYEQLQRFTIPDYGDRSGYFNEFEIYGFEIATVEKAIIDGKEAMKNTVITNENRAYIERFEYNINRLEELVVKGAMEELSKLTALVQQQTSNILNDKTVVYNLKTDKLEKLIKDTTVGEDDFYKEGWLEYQHAINYGKVIYYDLHTNQAKVNEAVKKIQEIKDSIQLITITSNMPIYTDDKGYAYELKYLVDGDMKTKAWFTKESVGDYIQLKFREEQKLTSIKVSRSDNGWDLLGKSKVEVSTDKVNWIEVGNLEEVAVNELTFEETKARYVRITVLEGSGWADVGEIQFNGNVMVDTGKLERLLDETYERADYTKVSYDVYEAAKNTANELLEKGDYTQAEVNSAYDTLVNAISGLVKRADVSDLKKTMKDAEKLISNEAMYTTEYLNTLKAAYDEAKAIMDSTSATQSEVDAMVIKLNTIIANPVLREDTTIMRGILANAIRKAQTAVDNGTLATLAPAVKTLFNKYLMEAKAVYENKHASNVEIITAWKNLADMMQYLDFKADKTSLNALIVECELIDPTDYTIGVEDFNKALAAAKEVSADDNALQTRIDVAYGTLFAAKDALDKETVTKTTLKTILDLANRAKANAEKYQQNANWTAMINVLQKVEAVFANDKATQREVNEAAMNLALAYENIRLLPNEQMLSELNKFIIAAKRIDNTLYSVKDYAFIQKVLVETEKMYKGKDFSEAQFNAMLEKINQAYKLMDAGKAETTKQSTPHKPGVISNKGGNPNTGDTTNVTGLLMLFGAAALMAVLARKRYQKD